MTKQLIIMGKDNLNNSLLASYIEKNTDYPCYVADLAHCVPPTTYDFELANLLLLDCTNLNNEKIHSLLTKCNSVIKENIHLALFNISDKNKIECFAENTMVKGIFTEDVSYDQFILGIKSIFNGELWLSRKLLSSLVIKNRKNPQRQNEDCGLTQRETEIIKLVAAGSCNNDIADTLCLSPHTVKTHIYHIYKKLNVDNRMQAANWANQHWNIST